MKKLLLAATTGTLAGFFLTANFTGPLIAQETASTKSTYENLDLFGDVFERIRSSYVEEVDEEKLIQAAINGMLSSLDPHSNFMDAEDFDSMRVHTKGEFGGLGIEVTQENGFVKVITPIDDTPAQKAGVMAGDFITKVDGEPTLGMTLDEAVKTMRGPVGAEIIITIVREGTDEPFDITIVRDQIRVKAARVRLEGDTVVMRVSSFTEQTYNNLKSGVEKIVTEAGGMDQVTGFVLDLRNNPGGLLRQAELVSDAFLESGEIVSTRGRDSKDSDRRNATPGDITDGKALIVLINGGSASASEIVAGALQDHHRAVIIGTRSFGKGSVQTIMPLQSGSGIKLTTARYYTPSGRSIQALGVSPDILVEQRPAKKEGAEESKARNQRFESDLRGSLSNDSLSEDEKKQMEDERKKQEAAAKLRDTDYQLSYALDLLKGLTVLSSGN
ncbi:MAG: peptidase S41 [Rhodobacteraceae bacterium]|nr:MAG: peptidase S41 [Paracoccaceae bacterium]